jgi:hypothetical protein
MVVGWKPSSGMLAAILLAGVGLAGCSETLPLASLPSLTKPPETALTKDEQEKAMNQMIEKAQTLEAEAAKQIEKGK